MLFRISGDSFPIIYEKAENRDSALLKFRVGLPVTREECTREGQMTASEIINHPSFKCESITWEQFDEEMPKEFKIDSDVSF